MNKEQELRLYGVVMYLPQLDNKVITKRISLLNQNLKKLFKVNYLKQDSILIDEVIRERDFWIKLKER